MDPVLVVVVAAVIGAGSSIAGTALAMWWSGRRESAQFHREETSRLRAEKRAAYADIIKALDRFREATVDVGEGERRDEDWERYWRARERTMATGATLQLIGTDDMIGAASEAIGALMDVGWEYHSHAELHHGPVEPPAEVVLRDVWNHVQAADREVERLLDLMRVDLGFAPLLRPRPTPPASAERTEPEKTT